MKIVPIVEGHGEVEAVPVLLRRLAAELGVDARIERAVRRPRGQLVKQHELERAVAFAANATTPGDGILVVLDADEDCPARLGPQLLQWARAVRSDRRIAVVLANREFEAWFLAAANSLVVAQKLVGSATAPENVESISDPKGWLREAAVRGTYLPTLDQARFASVFDWRAARRADSFDKFVREVGRMLGVPV